MCVCIECMSSIGHHRLAVAQRYNENTGTVSGVSKAFSWYAALHRRFRAATKKSTNAARTEYLNLVGKEYSRAQKRDPSK